MTVLITGAAGFIGASVCERLLREGRQVIGVDNLGLSPDPFLRSARLDRLKTFPNFDFRRIDVADDGFSHSFSRTDRQSITGILHLAAQAGVRHSTRHPLIFADTNVRGQVSVLELARDLPALRQMVYASSSSVYGRNTALPFRESDRVDRPSSFYAVSKRAAELTAECYQHLYGLPLTGLRFFTVYGPWGRPDMACYKFARAILCDEPVTLYEGAHLARDFTYIDDVTDAIRRLLEAPPSDAARILNIGNTSPEPVTRLVALLERALGKKAHIVHVPRPDADIEFTWAAIDRIQALTGWKPRTDLETGIDLFARWLQNFEKTRT